MNSLATRLTWWYVVLFGVLMLLATLATSLLLIERVSDIYRDVFIAKRYEAHRITRDLVTQKVPLATIAPQIVARIKSIGVGVAVFDDKGNLIAGDPQLKDVGTRIAAHPEILRRRDPRDADAPIFAVGNGFVVLAPATGMIWGTLGPYWWMAGSSLLAAILIAWFIGRTFAARALQPLTDVTDALSTLAAGDFSRRTFSMSESSEIGALAASYNAAAERVAAAIEERQRTETRMRQFVADAGHELRTPLTVIAGYIDVLRRGAMAEPAVASQILETMGEEGIRMRTLIERLLRLARLDGDTPPQAVIFDLARMASDVAKATRNLAPRTPVTYTSDDGAITVEADEGELREALRAIVDNALKYASGAPLEIAVSRNGSHAQLRVRDEGPGMTPEERAHAFDRFFRGESVGDVTGAGLGLAIAKRAVERAGGTIDLDSGPGRGTTVTIRVPCVA